MSTFVIFKLNKGHKLSCLLVLDYHFYGEKMKGGVEEKKVIELSDAPGAVGPYSQAIQVGNLMFTSVQLYR